jgi:hypothetical protein
MNNSGWKAARRRAALRYPEELGRSAAEGFRRIRVHDLKHTFGYRLRAAGVGFEDRKTLLGHKASHVTTHYSAADIETLVSLADKVCELGSRKSPALSIVRAGGASQMVDLIGGKGGTRTLDPGIMRKGRDSNPRPRHYERKCHFHAAVLRAVLLQVMGSCG